MKNIELRAVVVRVVPAAVLCSIVIFCAVIGARGQSTTVSFPTPVRTNEITGTIRARDVGDSRLTTYFYTFQGNQGDVFVNVTTKNFTGDVDLFLADGLRPLTKVVVYADAAGESETGRVIYLRRPEKLILRVEGRSPNDDPAAFRIKFAGSFEASKDPVPDEPETPEVRAAKETGIRVNSVGTIVEVVPKSKPTPKGEAETVAEQTVAEPEDSPAENRGVDSRRKPEVVVSDNTDTDTSAVPPRRRAASRRNNRRRNTPPSRTEADADSSAAASAEPAPPRSSRRRSGGTTSADPEPDPLAGINLVIEFKDGSRIERPMNEVMRFTFDRGVLTVVSKNGTIGRYPIADVARTTIQ